MRKRTLARDAALKILYQAELTKREVEPTAVKFWGYDQTEPVDTEVREFARRIIVGVEKERDKIDEKISSYATNWQLKRMAVIDSNVLRIGVFELLYASDIPPKVTI